MTDRIKKSDVTRIEESDVVLINKGTYAGTYGSVDELRGDKVLVYVHNADYPYNLREYSPSSLTRIPPVTLTAEELQGLARFDTDVIARICDNPHARLVTDAHYQMTLDDLEIALQNIIADSAKDDPFDIKNCWLYPVFEQHEDVLGVWNYIDGEIETDEQEIRGVPCSRGVFSDVYNALDERFCCNDENAPHPSQLLDEIRMHKRNLGKPLADREFSQADLEWFLENWDNDRVALFGTPEITALYVRAVNELAAADVPIGLHEKAYACYGKGNVGFDEDWETSRDCLLKLEEIEPKSIYANTLGYIYYYGRCTGGEPEYDKAFYWYSIGAAGGIYASRYKIADMIKDGKGCHKDREIAAHIVWDLFNENREYFCRGIGRTKFADIALRAGNLYRDGINCMVNLDEAYRYYLMAKLAIRMRRQSCDEYGDASVEKNIDDAIESVLSETIFTKRQTVVAANLQDLLCYAVGYGRRVRMDYRKTSASKYRLTFRIQDRPGTRYASKIPICLPEAHFCGLLEKLVVKADLREVAGLDGDSGSVVFDAASYDWPDQHSLMMYGEKLVQLNGGLTVNCRNIAGKSRRYVSVSFDDPGRCLDYLCDDENMTVGSKVRVPYGKMVREGVVKRVCERFDCEVELPKKAYRRVIGLV